MAIISGVTVNWKLSPRMITIPAPTTSITLEDLQDTLLDIEDSEEGISFPKLRDTSGGENLGGGVSVGWTMQLNNAQIAFEARTTPVSGGLVTANDSLGTMLMAASASFISWGVQPGATVINFTDGSVCSVLSILSETSLKNSSLKSGNDNTWTVGDSFKIYNEIQCSVAGGNLVAVDSVGNSISPILATAFVQVLKTSSSSATLQELESIQHSSFSGGITIDVLSSYSGTEFPTGTPQQPVNNILDALSIAQLRGLSQFFILGNLTLSDAISLDGFSFIGESQNKTLITIDSSANVPNCEFYNSTIQGTLDGSSVLKDCKILNLNYVDGEIENCLLDGTITLFNDASLINCFTGGASGQPTINMGSSGANLSIKYFSGDLKITNKSGPENVNIDLSSGKIILDNTIINGTVIIRGIGELEDNSSGTALVISHYLTNPYNIRKNLINLIESQRPHHTGSGQIFYWDPTSGDDTKDGISEATAFKTFAKCHSMVNDWGHDIIYGIANNTSGPTITTENLTITKNMVFVRGPGFNFHIHSTSATPSGAVVFIAGKGVELSGFHVEAENAGPNVDGILITGQACYLKNIWVEDCTGNGIILKDTFTGYEEIPLRIFELNNVRCEYNMGHGLVFGGNVKHCKIVDGSFSENGLSGITFSSSGNAEIDIMHSNFLENGQYGIDINQYSKNIIIEPNCVFSENASGNIKDLGIDTLNQYSIDKTDIASAVWNSLKNSFNLSGSFGEILNNLNDEAFGKWVLNPTAKTLTLYKSDGISILKTFNLTDTSLTVPVFIERTPI